MKLLLDACVWGGAIADLRVAGHDAIWVGTWKKDPGDEEILSIAYAEKRVLVTLDKDFGELAVVYGISHSGILRLVDVAAKRQGITCARILDTHGAALQSGAIITAGHGRLRVRD